MNFAQIQAVENELELQDRIVIAAEKWGSYYKKNTETYRNTIKLEAKLARTIRGLFRNKAAELDHYIDWFGYNSLVKAGATVETIVSGDFYDDLDSEFLVVNFEVINAAVTNGAKAGELIYQRPLGIQSTDAIMQRLTTEQLASLVGKKVDKDGRVIDNPNAKYRISDKTRNDINQSIRTSIQLGEDRGELMKRLDKIVKNPRRAQSIAQTESINSYATGLVQFAKQSGATGKEWEDLGATDQCAVNASEGIVPLNHVYSDGSAQPAAHTGCRCGLRIVYANEFQP